jgi:tRNA dimethylallyltransferase
MGESFGHARHAVDAVLIAGPTASGKSRAALELASAIGGTVIDADSMQVYREAPVLTAQPSDADKARVPHLLYGHVSAHDVYSVGRYRGDAGQALAQVRASGRVPVFAGGTGLYFAALTEGLAEVPEVPASIRAAARARLDAVGVAALHAELDPQDASRLRPSDPQRVLRAYEVLRATGKPLAHWQAAKGKPVLEEARIARFVLDLDRSQLRARIRARFEAMLDRGALEEAAALRGLDPATPAAKILGLRELWALQEGRMPRAEAVRTAAIATGQFAKRQSTWFRNRMADWNWLDAQDFGNILPAMLREVT